MASVLTRERWNEIVRSINDLAANPDSGCDPLPPLEEVPPQSKWRKSDIQAAQDLLMQICDENEFSPMPAKWKQSIIDELQTAIERGWCGCDDDDDDDDGEPCDPEVGREEDGLTYIVRILEPRVLSNCFNDDPDASTPICSFINGLQVASPGYADRQWRLERHRTDTSHIASIAQGPIDCDGICSCTVLTTIPDNWGVYVGCGGDCGDSACVDALADAGVLASQMATITYKLVVFAQAAQCCEDDEEGEVP